MTQENRPADLVQPEAENDSDSVADQGAGESSGPLPELLESVAVESPWKRWYQGRLVWGLRFGGFRSTWFDFLARWRARRLGRNFEWLVQDIENIQVNELRAIGPYWYSFASALGKRSEELAQSLGAESAVLGRGLKEHSGAFANGLNSYASYFAKGLGDEAGHFFEGLGRDNSIVFMRNLSVHAGEFIAELQRPELGFEAFGPNLPELLGRDEALSLAFLKGLGDRQVAFFEFLHPHGVLRWILALCQSRTDGDLVGARLLTQHEHGKLIQQYLVSQTEELVNGLNRSQAIQSDQFLLSLGQQRDDFLLKLGPNMRYFCQVVQRGRMTVTVGRPVLESIARNPKQFASALSRDAGAVALSFSALDSIFEEALPPQKLRDFMIGLEDQLGHFILRYRNPGRLLEVLAAYPEAFFDPMSETQIETFARSLGASSGLLAASLGSGSYHFARVIGPKIQGFGRGLGRHSREFIRQLGGTQVVVERKSAGFFGALKRTFKEMVDRFTGNFYTAKFLKGLTLEQRRLWFEVITQPEELALQSHSALRCGLCHEELCANEELLNCPKCATLIHHECLTELAGGTCPFDHTPMDGFMEVKVSASEDLSESGVETQSWPLERDREPDSPAKADG